MGLSICVCDYSFVRLAGKEKDIGSEIKTNSSIGSTYWERDKSVCQH
jgi:hypothetical protein